MSSFHSTSKIVELGVAGLSAPANPQEAVDHFNDACLQLQQQVEMHARQCITSTSPASRPSVPPRIPWQTFIHKPYLFAGVKWAALWCVVQWRRDNPAQYQVAPSSPLASLANAAVLPTSNNVPSSPSLADPAGPSYAGPTSAHAFGSALARVEMTHKEQTIQFMKYILNSPFECDVATFLYAFITRRIPGERLDPHQLLAVCAELEQPHLGATDLHSWRKTCLKPLGKELSAAFHTRLHDLCSLPIERGAFLEWNSEQQFLPIAKEEPITAPFDLVPQATYSKVDIWQDHLLGSGASTTHTAEFITCLRVDIPEDDFSAVGEWYKFIDNSSIDPRFMCRAVAVLKDQNKQSEYGTQKDTRSSILGGTITLLYEYPELSVQQLVDNVEPPSSHEDKVLVLRRFLALIAFLAEHENVSDLDVSLSRIHVTGHTKSGTESSVKDIGFQVFDIAFGKCKSTTGLRFLVPRSSSAHVCTTPDKLANVDIGRSSDVCNLGAFLHILLIWLFGGKDCCRQLLQAINEDTGPKSLYIKTREAYRQAVCLPEHYKLHPLLKQYQDRISGRLDTTTRALFSDLASTIRTKALPSRPQSRASLNDFHFDMLRIISPRTLEVVQPDPLQVLIRDMAKKLEAKITTPEGPRDASVSGSLEDKRIIAPGTCRQLLDSHPKQLRAMFRLTPDEDISDSEWILIRRRLFGESGKFEDVKQCTNVLCALLWIEERAGLEPFRYFRERIMDPEPSASYPIDADFPKTTACECTFGQKNGDAFFADQPMFWPCIIREGVEVKQGQRRLPHTSERFMTRGSTSEVYEVEIAAGAYVTKDGETMNARTMIRKFVQCRQNPGLDRHTVSRADGPLGEWCISQLLRQGAKQHHGILHPLACVRHDDGYSLYMQRGDYSLKVFLSKEKPDTLGFGTQHFFKWMSPFTGALAELRGGVEVVCSRIPLPHRDLNFDNIICFKRRDLDGQLRIEPRIIDFGSALLNGAGGNVNEGNPCTPPELFDGNENERDVDAWLAVDVFSAGIILFTCAIWQAYGPDGVQHFRDALLEEGRTPEGTSSDKFFRKAESCEKYVIKPAVYRTMQKVVSTFYSGGEYVNMHRFADLFQMIVDGMICLQPNNRWDAQKIHDRMCQIGRGPVSASRELRTISIPSDMANATQTPSVVGNDIAAADSMRGRCDLLRAPENRSFTTSSSIHLDTRSPYFHQSAEDLQDTRPTTAAPSLRQDSNTPGAVDQFTEIDDQDHSLSRILSTAVPGVGHVSDKRPMKAQQEYKPDRGEMEKKVGKVGNEELMPTKLGSDDLGLPETGAPKLRELGSKDLGSQNQEGATSKSAELKQKNPAQDLHEPHAKDTHVKTVASMGKELHIAPSDIKPKPPIWRRLNFWKKQNISRQGLID